MFSSKNLVLVSVLVSASSVALAFTGEDMTKQSTLKALAADGSAPKEECADLDGEWSGTCTVKMDGEPERTNNNAKLRLDLFLCKIVTINRNQSFSIGGQLVIASSGELGSGTTTFVPTWSEDKQKLRMEGTHVFTGFGDVPVRTRIKGTWTEEYALNGDVLEVKSSADFGRNKSVGSCSYRKVK